MNPRVRQHLPTVVLAVAVYLPLLLTAPGRVGADTKSYLYLDPDRLLARAWSMWDPSSGLGGLSHQTIGYLWPMGPWYWAAEHLGVPDWIAQRLWLGTILFAAGLGTRWLLQRVLGWRAAPATAAAFTYACTPYVLSLAARISVILLPFAGLPWLVGLTILAVRRGGWRDPARFALVVATVGSVNATALALVGLGPLWWLVHARATGAVTSRRALAAVGRIAVLTVAVNLWWIGGLWAQSGYGIDILRSTETVEAITTASNAVELLRGLGYWFFYGSDRLGPWIEPAVAYTQRLPLLVLTFALPAGALLALGAVRFRERAFATGLVVVGLLAAVGAHPYDHPPLSGRVVKAFLATDTGLAMRSLPRAVPLLALGLAMALGAGAAALGEAVARWRPRWRTGPRHACAAVAVLAYAALPPLWTGGMVAGNLDRPEDVPRYWLDAAAHLDARGKDTRVLELPGAEFASYRWGNTVDPISPGIMDRPQAAHELIPYGSPPSADLLAALDVRVQERTLSPDAVTVLARLLGAGDVLLRDDLQYERYRTPRPYTIAPFLRAAGGLADPVAFGDPVVNQPVPAAPLDDELALARRGGPTDVARPPLEVFEVLDPVPIVRTHPDEGGVVLAGDGQGVVDAADAGLLTGAELLRYGASLAPGELDDALASPGARYLITDQNRRQGRRWSTVRDVFGLVEPPGGLTDDPTDNRLDVFGPDRERWQTTAAQGEVLVAATSYGNPISFTPEYRPANAVDGNPATEWRTGADADVVGERLVLTIPAGSSATGVRVVQQLTGARNRHLTAVDLRVDGGPAQRVALDERSLTVEGQDVPLAHDGRFHELSIELVADSTGRRSRWGRPQRFVGLTQVGFAEISLLGDGAAPRVDPSLVLPPAATEAITEDVPLALLLTRWRTDPTDAVRQDPEPFLARRWSQPVGRTLTVGGTARLTPDALDPLVDAALGTTGPVVSSSTRLIGWPAARASAALDGDPATWWSPSFFDDQPWIEAVAPAPVTLDRLAPVLVDDGVRSIPTQLSISADGGEPVVVDLPPPGGPGAEVVLPAPLTGTTFRFTVTAMAPRASVDWFSQRPVQIPPALAELGVPAGLTATPPPAFDTGCRADLLTVDGVGVPIRVTGDREAALAGEGFPIEPCGDGRLALGPGEHLLRAADGLSTGIDIDQLVLTSGPDALPSAAAAGPAVEVLRDDGWRLDVRISGAEPGTPFWLVLGQSFNRGWELGGARPDLVDGFANGWRITPGARSFELTLTWTPQRVVNVGLAGSAVAALGCLVLALRRRPGPPGTPAPAIGRGAAGRRREVPAVGLVTLGSLAAIGPLAALVVGAVGLAAVRWRPARRALALLPAATYGLAASYVLVRQAVSKPSPAFEWPAEQATAHQPALVAIAFLVLAVTLGPAGPAAPSAADGSSPGSGRRRRRAAELGDQVGERAGGPFVGGHGRLQPSGQGDEGRDGEVVAGGHRAAVDGTPPRALRGRRSGLGRRTEVAPDLGHDVVDGDLLGPGPAVDGHGDGGGDHRRQRTGGPRRA